MRRYLCYSINMNRATVTISPNEPISVSTAEMLHQYGNTDFPVSGDEQNDNVRAQHHTSAMDTAAGKYIANLHFNLWARVS